MNCRETYVWLLASRPTDSLPPDVQRHLQQCPGCRQRRQQLAQLDAQARQLAPPADNSLARQVFLQALDGVPQQSPRGPRLVPRPNMRDFLPSLAATAAAAILLLLLGGVAGYGFRALLGAKPRQNAEQLQAELEPASQPETSRGSPSNAAPKQERSADKERGLSEKVIQNALGRTVQLSPAGDTGKQLSVLSDLAGDLRGEAVRLVRQGPLDEVPFIANLYGLVLRCGIGGRFRKLTEEQQDRLAPELAQGLDKGARALAEAAEQARNLAGDVLEPMIRISESTGRSLRSRDWRDLPDAPPPAFPPLASHHNLLAAAVLNCLLVVREDDMLRRTSLYLDLGDVLTQNLLLASATGEAERSVILGGYLGEVMEKGVAETLDRVAEDRLDDSRQAELERVNERAGRATGVLEKKLERASGPARVGLEKAMEASQHGRGKAAEAGKSKGKGKGKDKKDKGPPGLSGPPGRKRTGP